MVIYAIPRGIYLEYNQTYFFQIERNLLYSRKEFPEYHPKGIIEDFNNANREVFQAYKTFL